MLDPTRTRTGLVVIQPTPFCNVNCRYCYLPNRSSTKRIDDRTLESTFEFLFAMPSLPNPVSIFWHAGEPLVLPVSFYENAFRIADQCNTRGLRVVHSFQTNGTLINQDRNRATQYSPSAPGDDQCHGDGKHCINPTATMAAEDE